MKPTKDNNIEEISTMAAGAIEMAPQAGEEEDTEQEKKLRSIIRESIRLYAMKKKSLSQENVVETKIREKIRSILLNEKESKDPPPASTLEGVMRSLLNNIIPQIRLDYMKLQTNNEERQGFKDYFYNAVEQTIDVAHDQMNPDNTEEELEEQEKIVLKSDDPDFIAGVSDGTEEKTKDKEQTAEKSKNISSYYDRGQNFGETAFNAIKDRIQNAVYSQIVPEEYPQFIKVLNANLQAWFKIWDTNRTQEEPIPAPAEQDQEAMPPTDLADQPEAGADELSLEEDFEIELE